MRRVALATEPERPNGIPDDARLTGPCAARGIALEHAVWSDPGVDWSRYDAVLQRTVWDYYQHLPAFLAWIDALPAPVYNPPSVVRWNATKTYLLELEAAGVPVVPNRLVQPGAELGAAMAEEGWSEAVLKPLVSAGAWRTHRLNPRELAPAQAELNAAGAPMLLQPFLPEIQSRGEWSLLYFGGAFSHALRKVPADGDFRVQEKHGGRFLVEAPPARVHAATQHVLAALRHELLYARIDLVETAEGPLLIEAELIEPELFLRADPDAAARLAGALADTLGA